MVQQINIIDHDQLIDDNTATEYSESNVPAYVKALNTGHTELDTLFNELVQRLDLEMAEGELLGIIGRIVGQERTVISASDIEFFGFQGANPTPFGFADSAFPSEGGRLRAEGESTTGLKRLIDSEYRVFIRARIFKNHTLSTPEEVIEAFTFIFNVDNIIVADAFPTSGNAKITFTRELTGSEKALLQNEGIIPKTLGVRYSYADVRGQPFGFLGFPGALGFGDSTDSSVPGGRFANDITF